VDKNWGDGSDAESPILATPARIFFSEEA